MIQERSKAPPVRWSTQREDTPEERWKICYSQQAESLTSIPSRASFASPPALFAHRVFSGRPFAKVTDRFPGPELAKVDIATVHGRGGPVTRGMKHRYLASFIYVAQLRRFGLSRPGRAERRPTKPTRSRPVMGNNVPIFGEYRTLWFGHSHEGATCRHRGRGGGGRGTDTAAIPGLKRKPDAFTVNGLLIFPPPSQQRQKIVHVKRVQSLHVSIKRCLPSPTVLECEG